MTSTNCAFSALLNFSSLRRASSSVLVLTVYEIVASLFLVKVFKSWVYSLQGGPSAFHELRRRREGLPRGDVVILPVHTPDEPFDSIPAVVQDEDDRGQLIGDQRRQLLDSELPGKK